MSIDIIIKSQKFDIVIDNILQSQEFHFIIDLIIESQEATNFPQRISE